MYHAAMKNPHRLLSIDLVRGLASLGVLFTHFFDILSPSNNHVLSILHTLYDNIFDHLFWRAGGIHSCVVIFLTLSGFCIHRRVAYRRSRLTPPEIRLYYHNRAIRILPVFYVGLILGILVKLLQSSLLYNSGQLLNWSLSLLLASELLRFFFPVVTSYGNGPLATVINEIYIYLAYPMLQLLRGSRFLLLMCLVMALSYSFTIFLRFFPPKYGLPVGSVFELLTYWLIGALGAELCSYIRYHGLCAQKLYFLSLFLYVLYLLLINNIAFAGFHILMTPFLSLLSALAICSLVLLEERHGLRGLLFAVQPLAFIGLRSFSLYVVHSPLIHFSLFISSILHFKDSLFLPLISILFVLVFTEIVYSAIESKLPTRASSSNSN